MSKLYIVPTPIGNLDDITLRAVRVLREVDLILAEDTRTSSVLLRHLGIEKRLHAHHKFNEHATAANVNASISPFANKIPPTKVVVPIPTFKISCDRHTNIALIASDTTACFSTA